ncbi:MAG: hypothetical protein ACPL07_01085 [Candidatus Bathyarchaeia archaeon]
MSESLGNSTRRQTATAMDRRLGIDRMILRGILFSLLHVREAMSSIARHRFSVLVIIVEVGPTYK